jgi:signal peptidase II
VRGLQERRPFAPLSDVDWPPGSSVRSSPNQRHRRVALALLVAASVLAVDQLTKGWALSALGSGPRPLWGPLRLRLTWNRGAAFGLGGALVPYLALAAALVVLVLVLRGRLATRPLLAVALGMVLGGAVGNLADRLLRTPGGLRGPVVDFIDLQFWPVFNLADTAITIGCALLVLVPDRAGRPPFDVKER